jgi:hypothetical protein
VGASLGDGDGAGDSVGSAEGVVSFAVGDQVIEGDCESVGTSLGDGEGTDVSVGTGDIVGGQSLPTTDSEMDSEIRNQQQHFADTRIVYCFSP